MILGGVNSPLLFKWTKWRYRLKISIKIPNLNGC